MPIVIPWYAWTIVAGGLGTGAAAGMYVAADTPRAILKDNVLPLALIAGATYIAIRYIEKRA
jgi:hypothetical protein